METSASPSRYFVPGRGKHPPPCAKAPSNRIPALYFSPPRRARRLSLRTVFRFPWLDNGLLRQPPDEALPWLFPTAHKRFHCFPVSRRCPYLPPKRMPAPQRSVATPTRQPSRQTAATILFDRCASPRPRLSDIVRGKFRGPARTGSVARETSRMSNIPCRG